MPRPTYQETSQWEYNILLPVCGRLALQSGVVAVGAVDNLGQTETM